MICIKLLFSLVNSHVIHKIMSSHYHKVNPFVVMQDPNVKWSGLESP